MLYRSEMIEIITYPSALRLAMRIQIRRPAVIPPAFTEVTWFRRHFRFDHVVLRRACAGVAATRIRARPGTLRRSLLIHELGEFVRSLLQIVVRLAQLVHATLLHRLA